MKFMTQHSPQLPIEDYSVPLRNAVLWLGKRYLLAEPVKAHPVDHAFRLHRARGYAAREAEWLDPG
jgi:hypothetical protein